MPIRQESSIGRLEPTVIQWVSSSIRGQPGAPPLISSTMRVRGHRALDRRAAGLALALAVVAVADGEHRALDVDAEEDRRPGAHLRGVHVAAEAVGHQRGAHLAAGRGDADGAEHRLDRQLDAVVAVPGGEGHGVAVAVELVDPGGVRQRVLEGDDAVGAGHAAEERDRGRGAPVAGRLQRDEVQHQRVAGLGALDVERAGLRVDEPQVDLRAGQVVDAAQRAAERVVGPQPQGGAGLDPHRRGGAAEGVGVLLAGRRVLDDVHRRKLPQRVAQPYMVAAEVGDPRDAQQRQGARRPPRARMSAARCTPRSPPAIRP